MNSKLNIPALILSAGLASGTALGGSEGVRHPIEKTKESTFQVLSGKENMQRLKQDIEKNATPYHIRKNDTIAMIADRVGIRTEELLDLNAFLDKPLVRRGKSGSNILIKEGQSIFTPKDPELFHKHIDRIAEYTRVAQLNEKVRTGKINEIRIAPIFASSVQSLGLPNYLLGFIRAQQNAYDPLHPRVVDRSRESQVTCANAMRTLMGQSMNIADLSPKEQAFQRKQGIDAWMLPTELMAIGYKQEFGEIMDMFDSRAIGSSDPIKKDKSGEYREAIRAMNAYLEQNGDSLTGSFVPYHFKMSHFKGVVSDYNNSKKDKHYNTHQSMFAGNTTIEFGAWNVPMIQEGKMESFGGDKKNAAIETERLRKNIMQTQTESAIYLSKIVPLSDLKNNPEIAKKLSRHERAIEPLLRSLKSLSKEERAEKQNQIVTLLKEWNETKQNTTAQEIQKIIPGYKLIPSDLSYLGSFISYHYELGHFLGLFRKAASGISGSPIDGNGFGLTIAENKPIQQAIQQYNASLERSQKMKKTLLAKETLLKKPQETLSTIDFIVNFIQSRSDFGGSLSEGFRKDIYNGLSVYGDLLHIKINGKPVDIMHELDLYKTKGKKGLFISPEDSVEISGAMMVDGEKQSTHPDPSRQNAMNIRTRFFFEFFLSGAYRPTELLVPGVESSFSRHDFPNQVGELKIKGMYGLRMKYDEHGGIMRNEHNQALSENIEEVLRREIVVYENLNLDDPKFQEKLRRFYALQIKALQIAGFLQDENTLNRSAVNINRAIPYFDTSSINQVHASFIQKKKQDMHKENLRLAEIKNFIDIRTLPGDTYRQIFTSIVRYSTALGAASGSSHIQELSRLQDYKKRIFVERFLSIASRDSRFDARKFLENPKPYKSFILSLDSLESLLGEIAEISYTPTFSWLSETDQKVIELVTEDESYRKMLANILAVESYGETGGMFTRRNMKKIAKKFGYGSSLGDYQLRIATLFADLDNDKMLEVSLENLFRTFSDPEVQSFLKTFKTQSQIQEDLAHIEALKKIVTASKGTSLPKKAISDELSSVIRFDNGDGSNVVGKMVSASLLIDKLALHSEKLDYMLTSAGYDLATVFDDPKSMRQYERTIIRINNLPENQMLLALAENFVLRVSEGVTDMKIPTKTVFNESILSKGRYLGQIRYNKNIFLKHLQDYRSAMEPKNTDQKSLFFLKKMDNLIANMTARPNNTNENIYEFLRDKQLRAFLKEEDINSLPLPLEEEWNNDAFRSSVFHYVNKMDGLRKKKISEQ